MSVEDLLRPLLSDLRAAATLQDAADALQQRARTLGREAMTEDDDCALLRTAIYLRGDGVYRGMASADGAESGLPSLPSSTVWRWVQHHRVPFVLHTRHGLLQPADSEGAAVKAGPSVALTDKTARLYGRDDCTHLYGIPLGRGQEVEAILAMEFTCLPRQGEALFGWERLGPPLTLLCEVAAPTILTRPFRRATAAGADALMPIIGEAMAPTIEMLDRYAPSNVTVMLLGPTGVGKSRLAARIHARSARAGEPFCPLQLQNYPPELRIGHLFGWERGAFSGADQPYEGLIAKAGRGTLFLDEIGLLPMEAQAQLLEFLESRTYRRLRGDRTQTANVRIICATNEDLTTAVQQGRFRDDLLGRLEGLTVHVPTLDQRRDEIESWALRFLGEHAHDDGASCEISLSPNATLMLRAATWPHNLRSLKNAMGRAWVEASAETRPATLGRVTIEARHVRRAMGDKAEGGHPVRARLRDMAQEWLSAVEAQGAAGPGPLSYEDAFKVPGAYIVAAAADRHDDKRAMTLLGAQQSVEQRNYNRDVRRARDEVKRFEAALDPLSPTSADPPPRGG